MNSRPYLQGQSNPTDPADLLCPGSFLIGGPHVALPDSYVDCSPITPSNRWDRIKVIINKVWKLWHSQILHTLAQKNKWPTNHPNLQPGNLVWIPDTKSVPGTWPLGIVGKTYPDSKGTVRVVDEKTSSGILRRAIRNLVLVPIGTD